ncbi:hypothetical protein CROQUDRAFT_671707 [Cronartium quercuum f. sp. fusiforme G11]|uniref:Uncharacterized protein n=1 Tax=Cronartium quercuum f. sp. fusiforme G11 TaxID=708437 RepID=A0A9P6NH51_9BASI|nr:hypothetical protein CROQUDRAFT_671707 [Cronartium quercuum f. sp. fusiforme G11]
MDLDLNLPRPSSSDDEDDDEMDWEEVEVQTDADAETDDELSRPPAAFNIVLSKSGSNVTNKRKNPNSAIERRIRHETHRIHTLALVAAGRFRNVLINDLLLQARLLSMVPLSLVNAFSSYSPQTHPLDRDRSRLFDSAMKDLVSWWWQSFEIVDSLEGVRLRTWDEAEALFTNVQFSSGTSLEGKGKAKAVENDPFLELLETGEPIHGPNSLMKRALLMKGSRDMSAQLFTSLLRALDVPARLVFSLQPVTWRGAGGGGRSAKTEPLNENSTEETGASKTLTGSMATSEGTSASAGRSKGKGKALQSKMLSVASQASKSKSKRGEMATKAAKAAKAAKMKSTASSATSSRHYALASDDDDTSEEEGRPLAQTLASNKLEANVAIASSPSAANERHSWRSNPSGKASTLTPVVKLRKPRPKKSKHWTKSPSPEPEQMNRPPVFWTEVYSRPLKEWYPVDVTRKRIRCKNLMEPTKTNPENRMLYVIAFEEDNFIRDVTARYVRSFGATTVKARLPTKKGTPDWFEQATVKLKRPYKLRRDEKEDEEILKAQVTEALPTTVGGFKDHPNFALERHLRREEVIHPRKPIGTFRGEPVFPRSAVIVCKSAETYMREGRRIKGGQEALKLVKPRTVTINRKREEELLKMDGQEVALQGLYAEWQTELLIPPPIVDGIIPRNGYGNFDLFAPHMLPKGAKHLPYKGIAKTAKKLEVSYADAVVSFEFHKRRAAPVIQGIIVPELEAEFVLDAYFASEDIALEKEFTKLQERCLKRWKKIILGLRIKRRLQEEYRNQSTALGSGKGPKDGPSELKNIEIQPGETNPAPIRVNVPKAHFTEPPDASEYELYTDHRVNTLAMPDPSKSPYINGHKRSRSESAEAEQEAEETRATSTRACRSRASQRISPEPLPPIPTNRDTLTAQERTEDQQATPASNKGSSSPLSSPPVANKSTVGLSSGVKTEQRRSGRRAAAVVIQKEEVKVPKNLKTTGKSVVKPSRAETLRAGRKIEPNSSPSDRKLRPRK